MANALQRAAYQLPYEPEDEQQPLWKRLGNTALSGVAALGNVLDLPGSSARDLLGGHNPLDQWLPWNWTSSEHRTSGRDLARQYGLAGNDNTYGNFFGGMGLEIATDPLTFLTGGALARGAKAATAAKAAGKTPGLLSASIPFVKDSATELFTGPAAQKVAAGLGTAAEATYKPSVLAPIIDEGVKKTAEWMKWKRGAETLNDATAHAPPDFVRFVMPPADNASTASQAAKQSIGDFLGTQTSTDLHLKDQALDDWIAKGNTSHSAYKDAVKASKALKSEIVRRRVAEETVTSKTLSTQHAPESTRGLSNWHAPLSDPSKIYTSPIPDSAAEAFDAARKAATSPASDWAYTAADVLTTPARTLKGLFQAAPFTSFNEFGQKLGQKMQEQYPAAMRTARNTVAPWAEDLSDIHKAFNESFGDDLVKTLPKDMAKRATDVEYHLQNKFESFVNHAAEVDTADAYKQLGIDAGKAKPEMTSKLHSLLDAMKSAGRKKYEDVLDMGMKGKVMDDIEGAAEGVAGMGYFPRAAAYAFDGLGQFIRGFSTRSPHSLARHEGARYVPKLVLEQIAHDELARGPDGAKHILEKYGSYLNKETTERLLKDGEVLQPGAKVRLDVGTGQSFVTESKWGDPINHAASLADWAKGREPYQVYLNDTLKVQGRYHNALEIARSNAEAIHNLALEHAGPMGIAPEVAGLPEGAVQLPGLRDFTQSTRGQNILGLPEMYAKAGMDVERSLKYAAKKLGVAQRHIDNPETWKSLRDQFNNVGVPEDIANSIESARKVPSNPEWLDHIGQLSDIPTSWFKQNVTLPFAGFAARNMSSGQFMNVAGGDIKSIGDLTEYGSLVKQHFDDWKAGKLTPEQEREWFTNGVLSGDTHFEGVQFRHPEFGKVLPDNPLNVKQSILEAGQDIAPSELDKVPGLRSVRQAHGTVLTTGAKANGLVEFLNRVPMYEYLKTKGFSPEDAAKRVLELQVDYGPHNFSPFENNVVRPLVPFWAYQRKIAPVILKTLARNPAGVLGQTIRASRLAAADDPTTPSWVSDTLAIPSPFGSREEGGKAYITGLGLPHEAVAGYFGGGLRGAGRNLLSQLNPLIKAPLEWSTGSSFFQTAADGSGRPLDELNPPIGQTLANAASVFGRDASRPVDLPDGLEFLAANSPASRLISTARSLTDPRKPLADKALNALTGIRIAEVSPAASDTALFNRVSSALKSQGARTFSETYLSKDRLAEMSPRERDMAEQLLAVKKAVESRRKQRKKNSLELAASQ